MLINPILLMPKVKTLKSKKPPAGWETIVPTLLELYQSMREAENEPHAGKRKPESTWKIIKIHHHMTRYVYELYQFTKQITKDLLNYCIQEKWADKFLMAKWKKPGYEKLCCLQCIQQKNHIFGTTCICRVPKDKMEEGKVVECLHCGCRGCASSDV
jgi:bud site selection protein 31